MDRFERLLGSAKRLKELVDLKAPDPIVLNEIRLINSLSGRVIRERERRWAWLRKLDLWVRRDG